MTVAAIMGGLLPSMWTAGTGADDRRHGEFNDFDASGDSGTVFYLEAFDIGFELLACITSSDNVDPPALALPVGHHVQLKNGPSGSTNRASELILFPSSKIAPGDPSIRHKAARHTIGYCRSEKQPGRASLHRSARIRRASGLGKCISEAAAQRPSNDNT